MQVPEGVRLGAQHGLARTAPELLRDGSTLADELENMHSWLVADFRQDRPRGMEIPPGNSAWEKERQHLQQVRWRRKEGG